MKNKKHFKIENDFDYEDNGEHVHKVEYVALLCKNSDDEDCVLITNLDEIGHDVWEDEWAEIEEAAIINAWAKYKIESKREIPDLNDDWMIRKGCIKDPIAIDTFYGGATVAYVNRHSGLDGPANARMMCASKAMFKALESFLRSPSVGSDGPGTITLRVTDYNLKAAKEALAKATVGVDYEV